NTAIIIIVFGFLVSSIAGTFLLAMQNNTQRPAEDAQSKLMEQIRKQQEDIVKAPLEGYQAEEFDKAGVTELGVVVLREGEGSEATAESTVKANYFGWTSDGKIFDSTNR